ncbi:hypothetical protein HDU99_004880 [Rhizoclosmatium hyalinum]|nr:hypothetical protein HDU99_004880 [Rhizoclosmatium hyalinum]
MSSTESAAVATATSISNQEFEAQPKVFVGNLAFQTTDSDLAAHFASAGEVGKARVIRKFGRSQGYGFVSFTTEEAVAKAVETLAKSELNGRVINVDAARPREVKEPQPRQPQQQQPEKVNEDGTAAAPAAPKKKTRKPRGKKEDAGEGAEARIDSAPVTAEEGVAAPASVTANASDNTDAKPLKKRNSRSKKSKKPADTTTPSAPQTTAVAAEGTAAPATPSDQPQSTTATQPKPRTPRAPRTQKPRLSGPLSKTSLFVANLPFKVDSAALTKIFSEYSVASAKVVTLRNGRSKGFGFIELTSEEEQQRVLKDLEESHLNVDGRNLAVRVALELESKDAQASEGESQGEVGQVFTVVA